VVISSSRVSKKRNEIQAALAATSPPQFPGSFQLSIMGQLFSRQRRRDTKSRSSETDYVDARDFGNNARADNRSMSNSGAVVNASTGGRGAECEKVFMQAIQTFEANCAGDLSFCAGDIVEVLDMKPGENWCQVRHYDSGDTGYVPKHLLKTADKRQAASLDCWFEIDRLESERLLRMPGLENGTYLLRPHYSRQADQLLQPHLPSYSLSVRCDTFDSNGTRGFVIRHYRILPMENGAGFYVSPQRTFATLPDLLAHYQQDSDDRQMVLARPCPRKYIPPPNFRDFEINRAHIEISELIGSGSFGTVHLAKFGPCLQVAVKKMAAESTTATDDFIKEAKIMHSLSHPKIVQLIGVCTREEPYYIVTEYMPMGSLYHNLVKDREKRAIRTRDMMGYLHQVADGMKYLEERKYIHSDLRTANILMYNEFLVKVADFGLARLVESEYYRKNSAFPLRWSAPECISKGLFTIKSDVWSFGIVIFEVFSRGEKPYKSWRVSEVQERVAKGATMNIKLTDYGLDEATASKLYEFMLNECWSKSRKSRATFRRIKEFLEDFAIEGEAGYVAL
ncbi:hypothetical protein BOX15_Mlig015889g2, partial [Macrostomum lignano]